MLLDEKKGWLVEMMRHIYFWIENDMFQMRLSTRWLMNENSIDRVIIWFWLFLLTPSNYLRRSNFDASQMDFFCLSGYLIATSEEKIIHEEKTNIGREKWNQVCLAIKYLYRTQNSIEFKTKETTYNRHWWLVCTRYILLECPDS